MVMTELSGELSSSSDIKVSFVPENNRNSEVIAGH